MKNILIIGGSGFIGKNIIDVLKETDCKIIVTTRRKNISSIQNLKIKFLEACLYDTNLIKKIISDNNIEIILHLASNLIPSSKKIHFDMEVQNIILPTFEILNYISDKGIKIIYFSSGGAVYGNSKNKVSEDNTLEPINYYGYSKLMIENHIKLLSRTRNLKYIILRPSNVYGKYQKTLSKQGFIAVALGKMLTNQNVEVWGDGTTIRDYVEVSDIANIVYQLIKKNVENKILNVGSGYGHSISTVLQVLGNQLGKTPHIIYKDKRQFDVDKLILDISKLTSYMNYNPKKLDEGIIDFINYLKQVKPND